MREEYSNEKIKEDIALLADNVASLWRELHAKGSSELRRVRHGAQSTAVRTREMAVARARQADAYAHERPWVVAGVGAAVAGVLSALIMRKMRR